MFVCNRACVLMCANVRVDVYLYVCMFVCMCADMLSSHTNVRSHTDRCMRFDMYIRTNVRTNGPRTDTEMTAC